MTENKFVERSRLQVLYRYAPDRTVYHERSGQTERVVAVQMDPGIHGPPNVDPDQVKDRIKQDLQIFADSQVRSEDMDHYNLKITRPDYVFTSVYPAVWYCPNPECRRLYVPKVDHRSKSEDQLEAIRRHLPEGLRCRGNGNKGRCGSRIRQYTWLTTHHCGEEVVVPIWRRCYRHGDAYMHWYDQGSERVANWSVSCAAEGCGVDFSSYQSFQMQHTGCQLASVLPAKDRKFDTAPHQKAAHHMPRVLNLLNSGNEHRAILSSASDAARAAAGVLRDVPSFSQFDPHGGFEDWRRGFNPSRQHDGDIQAELDKWTRAKQATEMIPDESAQRAALSPIEAKLDELAAAGEGVPYQEVLDLARDEEYRRQVRDVAIFMSDEVGYGLDRIEASAVDERHAGEIRTARYLLDGLYVADIRYLEDVPLTAVLVGYMRGSYEPSQTSLRLYQHKNELRVYANDGSTEAVWIQLDPTRTLDFLSRKTGERVDVTGDFTQDLLEIHKRYDSSTRRAFGRIDDDWTRHHTTLLHTASHVFLKGLARPSGLELEGLSEEVVPFGNGFLVYANQSGEFTLGGLQIVFEHHLRNVLDSLAGEAARCVYNPICDRDTTAACHGCVLLGEVSCSHFNRLLDRRHLVGEGGFWSDT